MNIKDKPIPLIKGSRTYSVHSHTLYADDIMIFCKGDLKSIKVISNLKNMYVHCSSQICNAFKSLIFVGAMHPTRHKMLSDYLGFVISYPPFLYLEARIFIGRPNKIKFQSIANRIRLKLAAWKAILLSMTRRIKLVKFVVHGMMMHCLSMYSWSSRIVKNIKTWMRNFIWIRDLDKRKMVIVV